MVLEKEIPAMRIKHQFLGLKLGAFTLLISSAWLFGCTQQSNSVITPAADTQVSSTQILATTPTPSPYAPADLKGRNESVPTEEMSPDENLPIQPAKDFTPPPPGQLAQADLAIRLGVSKDEIDILSTGGWVATAPGCNLALNAKQKLLLNGSHLQVMLSYKNRSYEYWVFQNGDAQFALPCQ
jgi:hypothetical protein